MCILVSQGPNHRLLGLLQGFHIFQVHLMSKEWVRTLACPHTLELCRSHEAWSDLYVQSSWRSRFCFTPDEMSSKKWQGGHYFCTHHRKFGVPCMASAKCKSSCMPSMDCRHLTLLEGAARCLSNNHF